MVLNWVENTSPGTTDATDAGEQLPTTFPNGRRLLSVQQWADSATGFSSQLCGGTLITDQYAAWQSTGAPDVAPLCMYRPSCGPLIGNWIPETGPQPEWLQLSFPCAAYATSIQIYETYSGTKLLTYYIHLHSFPWFVLSLGLSCYGLDPLVYVDCSLPVINQLSQLRSSHVWMCSTLMAWRPLSTRARIPPPVVQLSKSASQETCWLSR